MSAPFTSSTILSRVDDTCPASDSVTVTRPSPPLWAAVDFDFGDVGATFDAGMPHLVLKIVVPGSSDDDMWLGYDNIFLQSRLDITGT